MKIKQISMVGVMALVLVISAVAPSLASAQQLSHGSFTLPCTTYWGGSVLPAGAYTYTITRSLANGGFVTVHGAKDMKMAAIIVRNPYLEESALSVQRSEGSAVVTTMKIAEAGVSVHFRTAHVAKELLAGATPQGVEEKIAVSVD